MKHPYPNIFWIITYLILLFFIESWALYNHFPIWVHIVLSLSVVAIENFLNHSQKYITLFFARKPFITGTVSAFMVIISMILIIKWFLINSWSFSLFVPILQFFLQGGIVGLSLRKLLMNLSISNLFGKSIKVQRLLLLLGIAIFLWLLPMGNNHEAFTGFYMLGFAFGFTSHFVLRRFFIDDVRLSRHAKNITEIVGDEKNLSEDEREAIVYYANQKWNLLNNFFTNFDENKMSTRLKLLRSCMFRIEGRYSKSLEIIKDELLNPNRNKKLDSFLYLQEALAHSESEHDKQMYEALRESEKIKDDEMLLKITRSLRLAEKIPLKKNEHDMSTDIQHPLILIRDAMRINADAANHELLSKLVGKSLPLDSGFIQDAYGYALLKAGDFSSSKALFNYCIEKEPSFSSAYLHLGEWYLSFYYNNSNSIRDKSLAKLCFSIALELEPGKKESRIARRAKRFIEELPDNLSDFLA